MADPADVRKALADRRAKRATTPTKSTPAKKTPAKKAGTKSKRTAKKAVAKKPTPRKAPAKKATKKAAPKKATTKKTTTVSATPATRTRRAGMANIDASKVGTAVAKAIKDDQDARARAEEERVTNAIAAAVSAALSVVNGTPSPGAPAPAPGTPDPANPTTTDSEEADATGPVPAGHKRVIFRNGTIRDLTDADYEVVKDRVGIVIGGHAVQRPGPEKLLEDLPVVKADPMKFLVATTGTNSDILPETKGFGAKLRARLDKVANANKA